MNEYKHTVIRTTKNQSLMMPPFVTQAVFDSICEKFISHNQDIFIACYPKSGTHWMRQIVHLLSHNGEQLGKKTLDTIPYLELEASRKKLWLENIKNKKGIRYFCSHFPYGIMPGINNPESKYIYLARNPKDCAVSFYYHAKTTVYTAFDGKWVDFFKRFAKGHVHYGLIFDHVLNWWQASINSKNIIFVTYEEMQKNLFKVISKVAKFINIQLTPNLARSVAKQSAFNAMANNPMANGSWVPRRKGFPHAHLRKG